MNKIFLLLLALFIFSCQSVDEAKKVLTNQKIKTTDEFLVKKKEPLELPPNYDKIPAPGSLKDRSEKKISEDEKIKKILKATDLDKSQKENVSGSTEKSILEIIKK